MNDLSAVTVQLSKEVIEKIDQYEVAYKHYIETGERLAAIDREREAIYIDKVDAYSQMNDARERLLNLLNEKVVAAKIDEEYEKRLAEMGDRAEGAEPFVE